MNTEVWDRIARGERAGRPRRHPRHGRLRARRTDRGRPAPVRRRRAASVSSTSAAGNGENAIALARQGAHVIALDRSAAQLARARKLAATTDVRVEWHECDAADLAFLRADSIDLVARGRRARRGRGHRPPVAPGAPRAPARARRSCSRTTTRWRSRSVAKATRPARSRSARSKSGVRTSTPTPVEVTHDDERIQVWPRTIADVFASAAPRRLPRRAAARARAGRRRRIPDPTSRRVVVWRARKEGV